MFLAEGIDAGTEGETIDRDRAAENKDVQSSCDLLQDPDPPKPRPLKDGEKPGETLRPWAVFRIFLQILEIVPD